MVNSIQTAEQLARQLKAVRGKKVKRLKALISSGTYAVDNRQLARAILSTA